MKRCGSCGEEKELSDFHDDKKAADGRQFRCKDCKREYCKEHYAKHSKRIKEQVGMYQQTDAGKASRKRCAETYRRSCPQKAAAQNKLNRAVAGGVITRQPCAVCGSADSVQGHHPDYTKPLDVVWLCRSCHFSHHQNLRQSAYISETPTTTGESI